jgi:hypothetical protein
VTGSRLRSCNTALLLASVLVGATGIAAAQSQQPAPPAARGGSSERYDYLKEMAFRYAFVLDQVKIAIP